MSNIQQVAKHEAKVFMGATVDDDWQGRLMVTVLAAEHWVARTPLTPVVPPPAPPEPADAVPVAAAQAGESAAVLPAQSELVFEKRDRGRFEKSEPTKHGDEDLDVPTFLRRGIKILSDRA
jgi:cell division protein FtsZ